MPAFVSPLWLRTLDTDPLLFVDRERQVAQVQRLIADALKNGRGGLRMLVTGARGVGKSIFSRKVVSLFADDPNVLTVAVNGRSVRFLRFVKELAQELQAAARERLGADRWLDELALLANNDRITRSQSDTVSKRYGANTELGVSLFDVLGAKGRFSWEESRSSTRQETATQEVTDHLLEAAIRATLHHLQGRGVQAILLFDDLDQANVDDVREAVKRVLDLEPCIALVHLRAEAVDDDIRRELKPVVDLKPLPDDKMAEMLDKRVDAGAVRSELRLHQGLPALRRLFAITGNPLAALTWAQGLLMTHEMPPPPTWTDEASLVELLETVELSSVEPALVLRLAAVFDRCAPTGRDWVTPQELQYGQPRTGVDPDARGLEPWQIEKVTRLGYVRPRDQYHPELGYQLDPILDLLRPSVQAALRASA